MEAPELRTARRTVFKRNDGTFEVHEATNAVNFQDAKGAWQQIDNHLVADGAGGFKNKANSFTVSFKPMRPGGGVSIKAADGEIRFVAEGADPSVKPVLSADGLTVTYPDVCQCHTYLDPNMLMLYFLLLIPYLFESKYANAILIFIQIC